MSLEGARELERKLRALGDAARGKVLRSGVRAAIKPAEKAARIRIPASGDAHRTYKGRLVAPGFARRSIRVVTKLSKDGEKASAALGVRKEAFYAVQFVERGTSRQGANPWLRESFASTQASQQSALLEQLSRGISKATR